MKYQYRIMGNGKPGQKNPVHDKYPIEWDAVVRQAQREFKTVRLERRTIYEPAEVNNATLILLNLNREPYKRLEDGSLVLGWETYASYTP